MSLSIATTEGGRRCTEKSKFLEIVTATLTTPPKSPNLVNSVDANKSSTLFIDLITAIRTMTKISERYRQLDWKLLETLPKGYHRIDLDADTYQEVSIKNCEHLDLGISVRLMNNSPASKIPSDFNQIHEMR